SRTSSRTKIPAYTAINVLIARVNGGRESVIDDDLGMFTIFPDQESRSSFYGLCHLLIVLQKSRCLLNLAGRFWSPWCGSYSLQENQRRWSFATVLHSQWPRQRASIRSSSHSPAPWSADGPLRGAPAMKPARPA